MSSDCHPSHSTSFKERPAAAASPAAAHCQAQAEASAAQALSFAAGGLPSASASAAYARMIGRHASLNGHAKVLDCGMHRLPIAMRSSGHSLNSQPCFTCLESALPCKQVPSQAAAGCKHSSVTPLQGKAQRREDEVEPARQVSVPDRPGVPRLHPGGEPGAVAGSPAAATGTCAAAAGSLPLHAAAPACRPAHRSEPCLSGGLQHMPSAESLTSAMYFCSTPGRSLVLRLRPSSSDTRQQQIVCRI